MYTTVELEEKIQFPFETLTHSVPQNEALISQGYAHTAHGTRASFHELYFGCLGKHIQSETGFKTNFLLMKGENSITCHCVGFDIKIGENMMASQINISLLKHWIYTLHG